MSHSRIHLAFALLACVAPAHARELDYGLEIYVGYSCPQPAADGPVAGATVRIDGDRKITNAKGIVLVNPIAPGDHKIYISSPSESAQFESADSDFGGNGYRRVRPDANGDLNVKIDHRGIASMNVLLRDCSGAAAGGRVPLGEQGTGGRKPPSGKPCPPELVNTHQGLLEEAEFLRGQIARNTDTRGIDLAVGATAAFDDALGEATAAADGAAQLYPALAKIGDRLRAARRGNGAIRARLPTSAAKIAVELEEKQRIVSNQIFGLRERAEALGCELPVPPPQRAQAPATPRLIGTTGAPMIQSSPAGEVKVLTPEQREMAGVLLADEIDAVFLGDSFDSIERAAAAKRAAMTALLINSFRLAVNQGTAAVRTGSGSSGSQVTTDEATVRSDHTVYLVHRDPDAALTFVHVREGQVTVTPTRGAAFAVAAGQSAFVTAQGATPLPGGPALNPRFEIDTDRRGSDYADFQNPANDPQVCFDRCERDSNCAAWSYVKPGQRGPISTCYLKNPAPAPASNACCISGLKSGASSASGRPRGPAIPGADDNTNRVGSDYSDFDVADDPRACFDRCNADNSCRAWTFIKPGQRGPSAHCYLKNPAPPAQRNDCCISGAIPRQIDQRYHFENDTNRVGSDYSSLDLPSNNPDQCYERCRDDDRCAAWTFVRPGVQGPVGRCYLKDPAPPATPNDCCVSGLMPRSAAPPPPPPPPPVATPPPATGNATAIDWYTKAPVDAPDGQRFTYRCPPIGSDGYLGLKGIEIYTFDSSICMAGVQMGVITQDRGGIVTIEMRPGQARYDGGTRNNVFSQGNDEGRPKSFVVIGATSSAGYRITPPPATTTPSVATPARNVVCNGFSGKWNTDYGVAELTVTGSRASGRYYTSPGGTIEGTVTGNVLEGRWVQTDRPGRLRFVLAADGRAFTGTWTEADGGGGGSWNGTCSGSAATPPAGAAGGTGGAIRVVGATYGRNCGAAENNVTQHVAQSCNGRASCDYRIDYTVIGDPVYGCQKDYVVNWNCGGAKVFSTRASPEAGFGSVVNLSCSRAE